jgi:hypothetical protein
MLTVIVVCVALVRLCPEGVGAAGVRLDLLVVDRIELPACQRKPQYFDQQGPMVQRVTRDLGASNAATAKAGRPPPRGDGLPSRDYGLAIFPTDFSARPAAFAASPPARATSLTARCASFPAAFALLRCRVAAAFFAAAER